MLDLNQRPPPINGGLVISQPFVVAQIYLQIDAFFLLNRSYCSPLLVWFGVLNPWRNAYICFALLYDPG